MSQPILAGARRFRRALPLSLVVAAALLFGASASTALAASGGIGTGSPTSGGTGGTGGTGGSAGGGKGNATPAKYDRLWSQVTAPDRKWARSTSECESGHDPDALGLGGQYRGAFQFTWNAWRTSPKTPGGDPIDYSWRTQAVVAVALKKRDGTRPWPVCG
jgi:hypothetical protein